ncbi:MAG: NUDIX hydrolase [Thermoleophilia bacterium]
MIAPNIRVSGFIEADARILLVRQRRAAAGYWLLPGGGVERGETLAAALEREVMEECGITAHSSGPPLAVIQTISPDNGATRHLIQIVFPMVVLGADPPSHRAVHPSALADPAIEEISWFDGAAVSALVLHPPIQDLVCAWLDPVTGVGRVPPGPCVVTRALWAPE